MDKFVYVSIECFPHKYCVRDKNVHKNNEYAMSYQVVTFMHGSNSCKVALEYTLGGTSCSCSAWPKLNIYHHPPPIYQEILGGQDLVFKFLQIQTSSE